MNAVIEGVVLTVLTVCVSVTGYMLLMLTIRVIEDRNIPLMDKAWQAVKRKVAT